MTTLTLLGSGLLAFASGLVFTFVGRTVRRKNVQERDRDALNAFGWWWYGLAALSFYPALVNVLAVFGQLDLNLIVSFLYVLLGILCAALWGLVYFLFYLFSGSRMLRNYLGLFYGVYYFCLVYLVVSANPTSFVVGDWGVRIQYENELSGSPVSLLLGLFLLLPPIVGTLAYLYLGLKIKEALVRYRVGMVGGAIFVWFCSSLVASFLHLNEISWWGFVSRSISLAAALIVLAAYRPPQWVQRRLALSPGSARV